MREPPLHPREAERLASLESCSILDSAPEPEFNAIVELASDLTGCPIAMVNLVDTARSWFKATVGLKGTSSPRQLSFCGHTILLDQGELVVEDARLDERFADNPNVVGPPYAIFYAGVPLRVNGGPPVGTVCVVDSVPRKLDEKQLNRLRQLARQVEVLLESRAAAAERTRSEAQLRAVLQTMHDGMVMQDRTGAVTWHNDSACRILALTPDQLTGRTSMDPRWEAVRDDGTRFPGSEHPSMVAMATGKAVRGVVLGIRAGDGERWLSVNAEPLFASGEATPWAVVASFHDVTESRLREHQLRLAMQQAESSMRAKSQFLATMSHELRTPMNGVIGLTELMLADGAKDEMQSSMLETIRSSGLSLLSIIDDVLDFSKIEAGGRTLSPKPCDVAHVARGVVELLRQQAEKKGLALAIEWLGPLSRGAVADSDALRQVLMNLVGNAIKFTPHGSVTVRLRAGERCLIEVRDTGIGLTAEQVPRLFQRFSQAESSTSRRFGGTGLGLAISKQLVEAMGGELGVTSAPGEGSSFWFSLSGCDAPSVEVPATTIAAPSGQPLEVLLVEDNPVNQRVSQGMLSRLGHKVTLAENGLHAVHAFRAKSFDLVLMDVQMPEMDGLEATRVIRKLGGALPIFALTASVLSDERQACLDAGMNDVLVKPLTMDALKARLVRVAELERAA